MCRFNPLCWCMQLSKIRFGVSKPSLSACGVALALLLAAVLAVTPLVDERANDDFEGLFHRALVSFALARTLNGVISSVQGTEVALQPAGVGLTLTPGELLDPVNDLIERFSWIMLGAAVSLGIQQVLLELSASWPLRVLVAALAALLIVLQFRRGARDRKSTQVIKRLFLFALLLRFAVPLSLMVNDAVYQQFLEERYTQGSEVVSQAGEEIGRMGQRDALEEDSVAGSVGLLGALGKAVGSTRDALALGERIDNIKFRAAQMIEQIIQLCVVFVLQTAILPLVFLWLFMRIAKWAFAFGNGK